MSAKWIWSGTPASENLYVIARTEFECPAGTAAELLVSADSDFAAFFNGEFLGRGQYSDFPDAKTFTRIPLPAPRPKNRLEIRVYYCGENFLNHLKGTPRLWAEVRSGEKLLAATGRDWEIADDPAFRPGPIEKLNPMLGFTWEYDARKNIPVFSSAIELDFEDVPVERPVPMIPAGAAVPARTVWHGYFKRREPDAFPGAAMGTDMVTPVIGPFDGTFGELPPDSDGWVLIVDLGRECAGLLHFEVEADAGTVLDLAHGEHLELGRVLCMSKSRERSYGDRYICREGNNTFTHYFRRYGARYLEMRISHISGPVRVRSFTLLPTDLKLPAPAAFHSSFSHIHFSGKKDLMVYIIKKNTTGENDLMLWKMIGGSEKNAKRESRFFRYVGTSKNVPKKRNKILLYITLALFLPIVFVALYIFLPEVYIELAGFFLPDEQYRISVRIGSKEYKLPLFFKSRAHQDLGDKVFPALILCGLPFETLVEHLKIFPDRLGVFPTCDLFYRGHFALLLREGAYTTYELEDDMKGWDVEYHIERKNGMVRFLILPYRRSPADPERLRRNNELVSFAIPEKLLKRIPCFGKDASWEKLPALQIIKPYRHE